MTANASARAIKPELLRTYTEDFNKDRANLIAADAAVSAGVLKAATDYRGVRALPRDFSIELKQGSITNQERSGRCWMFASLNTLRYELMHRWNLEDFEFSETYLFFWDAMEKSNTYLENVLRTLDEATDSRLFEAINESPADDGGWWQMFAALVNKYGLVPKSAYPESENSRNSDDFKQYLNSKLREFAAELRRRSVAGASEDELRALKDEYMGTVYRICAVALGEPPEKFDFFARPKDDDEDKKGEARKCKAEADADGKAESCKCGESCKCEGKSDAKACKCDKDKSDKPKTGKDERPQIREIGITPLEFYKKYVPVDVNDFVTLANAPLKNRPFNQRYRIRFSANVAEAGDMEFVNVPLDVFKKAALDQLTAGHPDLVRLRLHAVRPAQGRFLRPVRGARRPAVRHRIHRRQGPRPRIRRQPEQPRYDLHRREPRRGRQAEPLEGGEQLGQGRRQGRLLRHVRRLVRPLRYRAHHPQGIPRRRHPRPAHHRTSRARSLAASHPPLPLIYSVYWPRLKCSYVLPTPHRVSKT